MPSPKYTRRDDGLLEQDSGGYKALVIDPDGSFEREMAPPSPEAYAAIAPQVPTAPPVASQVSAADAAALAQPSVVGPTANPTVLPDKPPATPQVAPLAGGGGPKATLVDAGGGAPVMSTQTQSTRTSSTSTEGVDAASRKAIEVAGAKVDQGTRDVAAQERAAKEDIAGQRQKQASQDYMSGFTQQVGALEAEERYKRDYDEAMAGIKQERNTPPDPAKAWGSEKNEWAFIAGLGGALAALDEGVARLQKRGGAQPFDMIDKMVEQSLKQQEADRQQRIQAGLESADTAREEMLKARMQVNDAAAKVLGARKLLASSTEEATMLATEESKRKLAADQAAEERAKALATKKSVTQSNSSQTVTGPAGGKADPKAAERQGQLRELYRLRDTLRRAEKSGDLAAVVGMIDSKTAALKEGTVGLKPGQQEAYTALGEMQVGNLMRLVREPNNVKTQNMVQGLGIPKNDDAIPVQLARLDQLIADQEDAVQNVAPTAPAEQREAY